MSRRGSKRWTLFNRWGKASQIPARTNPYWFTVRCSQPISCCQNNWSQRFTFAVHIRRYKTRSGSASFSSSVKQGSTFWSSSYKSLWKFSTVISVSLGNLRRLGRGCTLSLLAVQNSIITYSLRSVLKSCMNSSAVRRHVVSVVMKNERNYVNVIFNILSGNPRHVSILRVPTLTVIKGFVVHFLY
jgi:hypothetical protein